MARINIEEKWFRDPRRDRLDDYLEFPNGTETVAVQFWRLSQGYWQKGELIPGEVFLHCLGAKALLQAGLARVYESKKIWLYPDPCEQYPNSPQRDPNDVERELNEARTKWASVRELHELSTYYVYACGSREHHFWMIKGLLQRIEAGKKSAEKRKNRFGSAQPRRVLNPPEREPIPFGDKKPNSFIEDRSVFEKSSRTSPNDAEPSSSFSSSSSISKTKKEESIEPNLASQRSLQTTSETLPKKNLKANGKHSHPQVNIGPFLGAYVKAYQARYNVRPSDITDPKVLGQTKNFFKGHCTIERGCEMVQVYLQMDDKWFENKGHDLITFFNNLNKIGIAHQSGSNPNGTNFAEVFKLANSRHD